MLRAAIIIVAVALAASSDALAGGDSTQAACHSAWNSLSRWDRSTTTYERYTTTCLRNNGITATLAAARVTAMCRDGTYTSATNPQGACSAHKGVARSF